MQHNGMRHLKIDTEDRARGPYLIKKNWWIITTIYEPIGKTVKQRTLGGEGVEVFRPVFVRFKSSALQHLRLHGLSLADGSRHAANSSETSVTIYKSTERYIAEDVYLRLQTVFFNNFVSQLMLCQYHGSMSHVQTNVKLSLLQTYIDTMTA
jgi:hypothetical protein